MVLSYTFQYDSSTVQVRVPIVDLPIVDPPIVEELTTGIKVP